MKLETIAVVAIIAIIIVAGMGQMNNEQNAEIMRTQNGALVLMGQGQAEGNAKTDKALDLLYGLKDDLGGVKRDVGNLQLSVDELGQNQRVLDARMDALESRPQNNSQAPVINNIMPSLQPLNAVPTPEPQMCVLKYQDGTQSAPMPCDEANRMAGKAP